MFTIAKINKNEIDFGAMFSGQKTPPITFVTDKIFISESEAELFIRTDLQKEINAKASATFNNGSNEDQDKWETILRENTKAFMPSEVFIVLPVTSIIEVLGRPEFLSV